MAPKKQKTDSDGGLCCIQCPIIPIRVSPDDHTQLFCFIAYRGCPRDNIEVNDSAVADSLCSTVVFPRYVQAQNRPYNSVDVFTNLHQKFGRTLVNKTLEKLAEEKLITAKAFGKTVVYFANQDEADVPSPEESREMDVKIAALKEELSALKAQNASNEKILASLLNSETTSALQITLDRVSQENDTLDTRLQGLRNGTRRLTVEDKQRVDAKLDANRKEWRVRRKWFNDAWSAMTENIPKKKAKEVLEEIGIETDEDAGISFDKDPLDGLLA